jgi:hypothetical protein
VILTVAIGAYLHVSVVFSDMDNVPLTCEVAVFRFVHVTVALAERKRFTVLPHVFFKW